MLMGMPFLFVCTLLFMMVSYWAIGRAFTMAPRALSLLTFLYPVILVGENQILVTALMPL
ncbi:hypothetical protein C8R45DRAFT_1110217 [Mycena sanguinolenta]|nr:hypothetical protein C8R45DRAFT_1112861 [Mycena sanguinolenta]KAJ6458308.1 hypothetical protein C8R45DRAFT_1110217 [Mycena sanguinolenta]